jgi:hypothetical protein
MQKDLKYFNRQYRGYRRGQGRISHRVQDILSEKVSFKTSFRRRRNYAGKKLDKVFQAPDSLQEYIYKYVCIYAYIYSHIYVYMYIFFKMRNILSLSKNQNESNKTESQLKMKNWIKKGRSLYQ